MREIELTFQKNIRDLGGLTGYQGKKVKSGQLYRGGFLDKITEEDAAVLKTLHLTHVIDFRSHNEFVNRPDYRLEGVEYINYPPFVDQISEEHKNLSDSNLLWFVSEDMTGNDHMLQMYRELVGTDKGKKAYRDFFKLLMDNPNGVFYFHCSQGKDRAGVASFLVETALGVDLEAAKEDYLRSNKAMKVRLEYLLNLVKDKPYFNERYEKSMHDVFSAKLEFLDAAIDEMIKSSGSIIEYIKNELHVNINEFRELFLEK